MTAKTDEEILCECGCSILNHSGHKNGCHFKEGNRCICKRTIIECINELKQLARQAEQERSFEKSKWNKCDECGKPVFNSYGVATEIYRMVHSDCDKQFEKGKQAGQEPFFFC